MSEIRKRIQQVTTPAIQNRRSFTTTGTITKVSEKTNTCTVRYIDKEGYSSNKDNVQVQINSPGIFGWFPKIGEQVIIELYDKKMIITGPLQKEYSSAFRSQYALEKEILHTNVGGTVSGMIF